MNPDSPFVLEARAVSKIYPGTRALRDVSLGFRGGQVHALMGKNGAGKSTLVKIIAGAVQPTSGQLLVDGAPVALTSPRQALSHGIATVYQELSLVPGLTVAENILFGRLPRRGAIPIIDWRQTYARAAQIMADLGLQLDVKTKVSRLSVAQAQMVEIAKAMSFAPRVLLLDEPTSALSHGETQTLFALIRRLAAQNVAIVYISHRLQELGEIADVMSVLRDGQFVGTTPIQGATPARIAEMMFGDFTPATAPPTAATNAAQESPRAPVLEVRGLSDGAKLRDISFALARGEVVGIAGLLGSGRTELMMAIFGATPLERGQIRVEGRDVAAPSPQKMMSLGVALSPEDRKHQGLVQLLSVRDNLVLAALDRVSSRGLVGQNRVVAMAQESIKNLQIAASDARLPVASLSGGNQQKVVLGKWLNTRPKVLLLDEPTRGIDVQAKAQVFQIIRDLKTEGVSSIFVSSELEELFEVCDRILIMRAGQIVGETTPADTTIEALLESCMEVGVRS